MPWINMVVGLIGRLNAIKEEVNENTEPPIKQSLGLEENVITFVKAFEHKIGEKEEDAGPFCNLHEMHLS